MRLLLVCATPMELRACLALLPVSGKTVPAKMPSSLDGFNPRDRLDVPPALRLQYCTLEPLVCGIGPVASALAVGHRLGRVREGQSDDCLQGILNMGVAGTYDADAAPVGSLVLITEESFPEYGVWHHQQNDTHMPSPLPFPQAEISGREIFTRLVLEPDRALGNMGMNWNSELPRGAGVTVAGVSGTPQRAGYIADLGSGLVENMEGFSLALGAAAARIPFVELRAISNKAGQRPPHGWDMTAALAALGQGMKYLLTPLLCGNATARDASASP